MVLAMGDGGEKKSRDYYGVLGIGKDCSDADLRNAYKKLAMRWHPDRWSPSGNADLVEKAKQKFQVIQRAYSVLSDSNKRLLYDVGAYESDDDDNGMGDFVQEMCQIMRQTGPCNESLEELQQIFVQLFQADLVGTSWEPSSDGGDRASPASSWASNGSINASNKRGSSAAGKASVGELDPAAEFCLGSCDSGESSKGRGGSGSSSSKRRNGRKQKFSSKHEVSSHNSGISARF